MFWQPRLQASRFPHLAARMPGATRPIIVKDFQIKKAAAPDKMEAYVDLMTALAVYDPRSRSAYLSLLPDYATRVGDGRPGTNLTRLLQDIQNDFDGFTQLKVMALGCGLCGDTEEDNRIAGERQYLTQMLRIFLNDSQYQLVWLEPNETGILQLDTATGSFSYSIR